MSGPRWPGGRRKATEERFAGELADLRAGQEQLQREVREIRDWLAATSASGDELRGRLGWLDTCLQEQARTGQQLARTLGALDRRVARDLPLTAMPFERFTTADGEHVNGFRDGAAWSDAVYLQFENVFRGHESDITSRQRTYVQRLAGRGPVLDVGCGRGELLELLRDAGIEARGVDLDEGMVGHCVAKGLDVTFGDGVVAVEDARGSLGAVVAAQVVEHLPYTELLRFLRGACAALHPGGIALLETVNPHAPQALKQFWVDPTHQHPLFPEVLLALLAISGFAEGYIWYPLGSGDPDRDHAEQPDYVIVATAPAAPGPTPFR